jgi:glutamate 5-kinase
VQAGCPQIGLAGSRRLVLKIGSALLVDPAGTTIRQQWIDGLAEDVAAARHDGIEIVLVSSGAVAVGRRLLALSPGPLTTEQRRAAAAAGQVRLGQAYQVAFGRWGMTIAQVLLTLDDTENRYRHLCARGTVNTLIGMGAVPLINENDSIVTNAMRIGDNDRLAARVAQMIDADTLVLLSDVDGMYTDDPHHKVDACYIPVVRKVTPELLIMAGGARPGDSSGGMVTKLEAARIALAVGYRMAIMSGRWQKPLSALQDGAKATWFVPETGKRLTSRRRWIAASLRPAGVLRVDDHTARALVAGNNLPATGIVGAHGDFRRGDIVLACSRSGVVLARGSAACSGDDVRRMLSNRRSDAPGVDEHCGSATIVRHVDLVLENTGPWSGRAVEEIAAGAGGARDRIGADTIPAP